MYVYVYIYAFNLVILARGALHLCKFISYDFPTGVDTIIGLVYTYQLTSELNIIELPHQGQSSSFILTY